MCVRPMNQDTSGGPYTYRDSPSVQIEFGQARHRKVRHRFTILAICDT